MTRPCSNNMGGNENSRRPFSTSREGVKIFGVRLTDGSAVKKSIGTVNWPPAHYRSSLSSTVSLDHSSDVSGSLNRSMDRKRSQWTEKEHLLFLIGLQRLGKGDWSGISRKFVVSRTPSQVASHAQKYFLRQNNSKAAKRRPSVFDMVPTNGLGLDTVTELQEQVSTNWASEGDTPRETTDQAQETSRFAAMEAAGFFPAYAYVPISRKFWPSHFAARAKQLSQHHVLLKPIPLLVKGSFNVEDETDWQVFSASNSGESSEAT